MSRLLEVTVKNKNSTTFRDSYLGMQFEFKPNEKVTIPLEAAIHIFGFNKKDKTANKVRLGIANHPDGDNWLGNFDIEAVEYVAKDELEEIEKLKQDLEERNLMIEELTKMNASLQTENAQLQKKLGKKDKTADE